METKDLLLPHIVQYADHRRLARGGCIEIALQFDFQKVHVIHFLIPEAARVHNKVE